MRGHDATPSPPPPATGTRGTPQIPLIRTGADPVGPVGHVVGCYGVGGAGGGRTGTSRAKSRGGGGAGGRWGGDQVVGARGHGVGWYGVSPGTAKPKPAGGAHVASPHRVGWGWGPRVGVACATGWVAGGWGLGHGGAVVGWRRLAGLRGWGCPVVGRWGACAGCGGWGGVAKPAGGPRAGLRGCALGWGWPWRIVVGAIRGGGGPRGAGGHGWGWRGGGGPWRTRTGHAYHAPWWLGAVAACGWGLATGWAAVGAARPPHRGTVGGPWAGAGAGG